MTSQFKKIEITCRLHGPMRYSHVMCQYICRGFDGEGCERKIQDELLVLMMLTFQLEKRKT
jgi:hypothetical protein